MPAAKKAITTRKPPTKKVAKPKTASVANSADSVAPAVDSQPQNDVLHAKRSDAPFRAYWRNPNEYPKPKCRDMAELAWEFLRRNEKYAVHVSQMLALPPGEFSGGLTSEGNACLDGMVCTPKAKPGETVKKFQKRILKKTKDQSIGKIEKPQLTFINRWMLEQPVPVGQKYDPQAVQFDPNFVKVYRNKKPLGRRVRLMMYPNEMAVRFRLDLPMVKQLDAARFKLNEAAKRFKKASKLAADKKKSDFLAFNGTARDKGFVEKDAHYWLRAYDAFKVRKVVLNDSDKKHKRSLKSGPAEIAKLFVEEGHSDAGKRNKVESYRKSAQQRIEKLGYQAMVQIFDAVSAEPLATVMNEMVRAKSQTD